MAYLEIQYNSDAIRHEIKYRSQTVTLPLMYILRDEYNDNRYSVNTYISGKTNMLQFDFSDDKVILDRQTKTVRLDIKNGSYSITFPPAEAENLIQLLDIAIKIIKRNKYHSCVVKVKNNDGNLFQIVKILSRRIYDTYDNKFKTFQTGTIKYKYDQKSDKFCRTNLKKYKYDVCDSDNIYAYHIQNYSYITDTTVEYIKGLSYPYGYSIKIFIPNKQINVYRHKSNKKKLIQKYPKKIQHGINDINIYIDQLK